MTNVTIVVSKTRNCCPYYLGLQLIAVTRQAGWQTKTSKCNILYWNEIFDFLPNLSLTEASHNINSFLVAFSVKAGEFQRDVNFRCHFFTGIIILLMI